MEEFIRVKILVDSVWIFFDWMVVWYWKTKTKKRRRPRHHEILYRFLSVSWILGGHISPEFRTLVSIRFWKFWETHVYPLNCPRRIVWSRLFLYIFSVLYRKFVSYCIPEIVWDHPRLIRLFLNSGYFLCVIPEICVIPHSGNCLRSPTFDLRLFLNSGYFLFKKKKNRKFGSIPHSGRRK